jgi:flagellar basal-body rod modification protein FlgD
MVVSEVFTRAFPETSISETQSSNEVGSEAFLKLLIVQLQNQDPLSPMESGEFMTQLAQLSALESTQNLQISSQALGLMESVGFVGQYVEILGADGTTMVGQVDEVQFENSAPVLVVEGQRVGLENVLRVFRPPAEEAGV